MTVLMGLEELRSQVERQLSQLERAGRARRLDSGAPHPQKQTEAGAPSEIDLTHNDYLGLREDREFQQACREATRELPCGAGASRLLGGEHPIFSAVEQKFAEFKKTPAALYFPSGFAANEAIATVLGQTEAAYFSDRLNHASLIDGIRLSRLPKEKRHVFGHRDLDDLERGLRASKAPVNVVFSESLFSMDGDRAPLEALGRLADEYRGVLVIDEAHATGCFGPSGRGLTAESALNPEELITVHTCGKAMGVAGAFICGPHWLREFLINRARSFIYTTAPSPWCAAAVGVAIDSIATMGARRERLQAAASHVRGELAHSGYDTAHSTSQIIPVVMGSDAAAVAASKKLLAAGVRVKPIRPPTVPEGTARLRLSLHAGLSDGQVESIVKAFKTLEP